MIALPARPLCLVAGAASLLLTACTGDESKSTGTPGTTGPTDTGPPPGVGFGPEDVDLTLTATGLTIEIRESSQPFSLGIAPDCDSEAPDCWMAESCVEEKSGYEFCHPLSATGGSLTAVSTPSEVISGGTTLFSSSFEGSLGYALIADDGSCFTWGSNAAYYVRELGCTDW